MPCKNFADCTEACCHLGYCMKTAFLKFETEELVQPEIVRAVRRTVCELADAQNIKPLGCRDWLYRELWNAKVRIIDQGGRTVVPDMDCFEPTDDQIDDGAAWKFDERLREFFRSNACRAPQHGRVFVTKRWHRHFASMATIIGSSYPTESQWWPRVINGKYVDPNIANVNGPPAGS